MNSKEAYQQKLQAQLAEWKAETDKLQARADQANADLQIDLNRRVRELQAKQELAKTRLDELRAAGEASWDKLKSGVDKAFHDVGEGIKAASRELQ